MLTREELAETFRSLGVAQGDLLLVHSALRKLGPVEGGADTVIDSLLDVLGPQGTLAVPTHTWKIVKADQPVFHQTLSPSNVGALTNVFRKRPGVLRGLHPTHSIAAIGPRAEELIEGHERDSTPCSRTSPYGRLCDWNGKVLIIGEGLNCCTLFHGCEECAGMPWAVRKEAIQLYSVTDGGRVIPVRMHTHQVNTWDQYPLLEPRLLKMGALRVRQLGDCPLRLLHASRAAEWLVTELRRDERIVLPPNWPPADEPGSSGG